MLAGTAIMAFAQTQAPSPAPRDAALPSTAAAPERTVSTGDFNRNGNMSGAASIGTRVKNANNVTVGSVNDFYLDRNGLVKMAIVPVDGFPGVGSKAVAVK